MAWRECCLPLKEKSARSKHVISASMRHVEPDQAESRTITPRHLDTKSERFGADSPATSSVMSGATFDDECGLLPNNATKRSLHVRAPSDRVLAVGTLSRVAPSEFTSSSRGRVWFERGSTPVIPKSARKTGAQADWKGLHFTCGLWFAGRTETSQSNITHDSL